MSLQTARAEAERLKMIMAKHGVKASVEIQAGRPWSGDAYYSRKHVIMNHDTVASMRGNTPSLAVCKGGRPGLPGPLCNGYGGRDRIYRIITMGLGNHPGVGGPLTVGGFTIPKDSARISAWGTEWEHDGVSPWPPYMAEFMGRSNAALCEFWRVPISRVVEHATWTRRKIDRSPGYTRTGSTGQAEVRRWGGAPVAKPVTPPKPGPAPKPPTVLPTKPKPLAVDGDWGPATWKRTQMLVRVPQTGKTNLATRKAVQRYLKVAADGDWGKVTIRALQRRSGLTGKAVDGVLGPNTHKAWQRYLNRTLS